MIFLEILASTNLADFHSNSQIYACAQGWTVPNGECVYIRQGMSNCVITNMLHFWHSKNQPIPEVDCSTSYIVTDSDSEIDTDSDCGRSF